MSWIEVPALLVGHPELSALAKVVWLAAKAAGTTETAALRAAGNLARSSAAKGLAELTAKGWIAQRSPIPTPGRTVAMPTRLLAAPQAGANAKLLYLHLQLTPRFRDRRTTVSFPALSALCHTSSNTLKQAAQDLVAAGWLRMTRERPRKAPHFVLLNPDHDRQRLALARAKRRLRQAKFKGEAIMREFLTALVDSDNFADDVFPGFLVNPLTGERLQFDRFYPPGVAFEFHGRQHHEATELFPDTQEVQEQQVRDLIKAGICVYRGITLVILHAEDLRLDSMRKKIGSLLPLRAIKEPTLLTRYLEDRASTYRTAATANSE